jgi:predicted DNA-binding transcriptional regulator YafY
VSLPEDGTQSQMPPDSQTRAALIDYTNYQGERSWRYIIPREIKLGSNEWHKEEQWLLRAYDLEKGADREFAMAGIHEWKSA